MPPNNGSLQLKPTNYQNTSNHPPRKFWMKNVTYDYHVHQNYLIIYASQINSILKVSIMKLQCQEVLQKEN